MDTPVDFTNMFMVMVNTDLVHQGIAQTFLPRPIEGCHYPEIIVINVYEIPDTNRDCLHKENYITGISIPEIYFF